MKYIDQLNIAKKHNINITKLFIANEVDVLLSQNKMKITEEIYEEICIMVYEYYLKIDYASINDVAKIVCDLFFSDQKINEKIIRNILIAM